jgi:hypothetical protein
MICSIKPSLRSIGALLLIAADYREMGIVGLLHPDAANPFNPQWLPMIPFVKFAGLFSPTNIANRSSRLVLSRTEWTRTGEPMSLSHPLRTAFGLHQCVLLT